MGQELALVLCKDAQQLELVRRELHRPPTDGDEPLLEVDHKLPDLQDGPARRRRPPQRRAQPGEQLVDPERLLDVIVGARVKRGDLLLLLPHH